MGIILNKDQQRRPFGGHHFPEQGMVVRGETFDELIAKVRRLRLINGHPEGDAEKEILRYYAEHFPYMVKTGEEDGRPIVPSNYFKWRDWIRYMWYDPPKKLLTKTEASIRWDICKNCPRNEKKNWKDSDEAQEFDRRVFMLRAGQAVPDKLGYCSCHKWDLGLAVFLHEPARVANKGRDDKQPDHCWVGATK